MEGEQAIDPYRRSPSLILSRLTGLAQRSYDRASGSINIQKEAEEHHQ